MPTRVIRLRTVDTHPMTIPSRLVPAHRWSLAERFAKYATVVTKLYSSHLDAGEPLVAKSSWVKLIPTDRTGPADLPLEDSPDGLVLEVPYDPAVSDLADHQRRPAMLDWVHENMLTLAGALQWDTRPLIQAYEACRRDEFRYAQRGAVRTSRDRGRRAYAEFEIDGDGDGWSWVVVTDPKGAVIAVSDRHDSPAAITLGARVLKSLRWDGEVVTWKPWTDDVAPRGHHSWLTHVERFAAPAS